MIRELGVIEVIWQCPNCHYVNHHYDNNIINIDLIEYGCKECNRKHTLRKNITQVLCEPIKVPVNYAG